MSIVLFFGLASLVTIVGIVFSALVIRHHWRQSRLDSKPKDPNTSPSEA